jgi:hypothetical protein
MARTPDAARAAKAKRISLSCYLCGAKIYTALRTWVPDRRNPSRETYRDVCFGCLARNPAGRFSAPVPASETGTLDLFSL